LGELKDIKVIDLRESGLNDSQVFMEVKKIENLEKLYVQDTPYLKDLFPE
jgi:hypothetical protein